MQEIKETSLTGKRILLLYARFFGYDKIVKEKLESLGAVVDLYDARANISTVEKAIKKVDSRYYYKKQRKFHHDIQQENKRKKYDFIFSNENIEEVTLRGYRKMFLDATMVLYLDDSVANMVGVNKTFHCYDRVLTFDKADSVKYDVNFRPLFFSDSFKHLKEKNISKKYDICFVGTCHSDRLAIISKIMKNYPNYKYFFYCYLQSWFMYYYYAFKDIEYRKKSKKFFNYDQISMDQVAQAMAQSDAILDIQHPKQTGLTMRTIETLGLGKKIITTNSDIRNYDFYNERNVLVVDRENPVIPDNFIKGNYEPLSEELYHKYSITGWIEDVFKK